MIGNVLKMLRQSDWLVDDHDILVAKGLYEAPLTFKEIKPYLKRKKVARNGNQ